MTYSDTHVVVWLYGGDVERLSKAAQDQMQDEDLLVSPAVLLELEYLHEIERKGGIYLTQVTPTSCGLQTAQPRPP